MKPNFLIVIPVYNESKHLLNVARCIIQKATWADILFINDGSIDDSKSILEQLKSNYNINIIHKIKNEGYGASLKTGFQFGINNNYSFLITMDCDDQHQPDDLIRFYEESYEIDLVSGSRYLPESKSIGIKPPNDRVEINQKITGKINRKYLYQLTDSFCGFKRYKTEKLVGNTFEENGYSFPLEFWAFTKSKNLSIKEIAVDKIYITDTRSFGLDLDTKRKRYRYYIESWKKANLKYFN